MAAKCRHVVQKELTSFFGFSQKGSKKAKGKFKILLCLDIEMLIFNSLSARTNFFITLKDDVFQCLNKLIQLVRKKLMRQSTLEDSFLDQQSISDESDVILALGLSREDSECDSDFFSDSEFD